jgi:hypothetical protein
LATSRDLDVAVRRIEYRNDLVCMLAVVGTVCKVFFPAPISGSFDVWWPTLSPVSIVTVQTRQPPSMPRLKVVTIIVVAGRNSASISVLSLVTSILVLERT